MQNGHIAVPQSYFYYLDNQNALDILDEQNAPPPSFSMDEVNQFCHAKASLAVCKYEFYIFMTELFKETWGKALKNTALKALKFGEMNDPKHPLASMDTLWEESSFFWQYKINDTFTLWLGCTTYENDTHFGLMCALEDREYEWEMQKELRLDSKYWEQSPDEDANFNLLETAHLVITKEQPFVDTHSLSEISLKAVAATCNFCAEHGKK